MNLKLNPKIISTLYSNGRSKKNLKYLNHLFDSILENFVKIDDQLLVKIENDLQSIKKDLILLVIFKFLCSLIIFIFKLQYFWLNFNL